MTLIAAHATLTLRGTTPLSQSRMLTTKTDQETHDAHDLRCWRDKAHRNAEGWVTIPAHGFHQCLIAAARHAGETIKGQGKKTWTDKFTKGLMIPSDAVTDVRWDALDCIALSVSSTGKRGVGGRVTRRFPIAYEWRATVEMIVLDPILTREVVEKYVVLAGIFIGIGRFRPEVGGQNGRFALDRLDWDDQRALAA